MIPAKREINQEIDTRLRIWDGVPIRLREQEISCMQVGEMIPCELNPHWLSDYNLYGNGYVRKVSSQCLRIK